jgi:hypothetical protein
MEPLGLLGALLGGYQQGRLTKQNREIKSAQLLRQQQENEALKKYRADSLDLQRARINQLEDPADKATRDLFLTSLKGIGDDVDNAFADLDKTKTTAEDYDLGAESIYGRFNDRYQQLRSQHSASPVLGKLGDFETISGFNVPNFVRAPKFDKSLIRRRSFDGSKFQKDASEFVKTQILEKGIRDPEVQAAYLDNWMEGQSRLHGKRVEDLWSISGIPKPNQVERGTTLGVRESGFIPTDKLDPNLPAFGTRTVNDQGNSVTYQHSLPKSIETLPNLQSYLRGNNGVGPQVANAQSPTPQGPGPTSNQMADEFIVDDLQRMFTTPMIASQFGLTDASNPDQFRKALQLYMNPRSYQDIQRMLDESINYGAGYPSGSGEIPVNYQFGNPGDFGTSTKGQGLQGLIQNAPLMANSRTLEPVPFERRTGIPLSLKDIAAEANIKRTMAATEGQGFTNQILEAKGRVAQANVFNEIRTSDLKTMLTGVKLALEPLKFGLLRERLDLDKWDDEIDNQIASGQLSLATVKAKLNDASTAARALLASAQKDLTSASMTLGSFLKDNILTSAVFKQNPALQAKIQNNSPLTPEDLAAIESDQGLRSNQNVKEALARYKKTQQTYNQAYAGVLSYANLASTFSNSRAFNMGVEPGEGSDNPLGGLSVDGTLGGGPAPGAGSAGGSSSSQSRPAAGGSAAGAGNNAGPAGGSPKPGAAAAPNISSNKPTNTAVIESARAKFAKKPTKPKGGSVEKPPVNNPVGGKSENKNPLAGLKMN